MNGSNPPRTLQPLVESLEIGGPIVWGNLVVVPLASEGSTQRNYLLAEDAIAQNLLMVQPIRQQDGSWALDIVSRAQHRVLIVEGEELVCHGLSYIASRSTLIDSGGQADLPVCVVAETRPYRNGFRVRTGSFSPPRLRCASAHCIAGHGEGNLPCEKSDCLQSLFDGYRKRLNVNSHRLTVEHLHISCSEAVSSYARRLDATGEACGFMAAVAGRLLALDLFESNDVLNRLWSRLIAGYVLSAMALEDLPPRHFGVASSMALLEQLGDQALRVTDSEGGGQVVRFGGAGMTGQGLWSDGRWLHLSAFPEKVIVEQAASAPRNEEASRPTPVE